MGQGQKYLSDSDVLTLMLWICVNIGCNGGHKTWLLRNVTWASWKNVKKQNGWRECPAYFKEKLKLIQTLTQKKCARKRNLLLVKESDRQIYPSGHCLPSLGKALRCKNKDPLGENCLSVLHTHFRYLYIISLLGVKFKHRFLAFIILSLTCSMCIISWPISFSTAL